MSDIKIQKLINSFYYGFDHIFIMLQENKCRLIGLHNDKVLTDQEYVSPRAAKIAFSRLYNFRINDPVLQKLIGKPFAIWTHGYPVDQSWLEPKIKQCDQWKEQKEPETPTI